MANKPVPLSEIRQKAREYAEKHLMACNVLPVRAMELFGCQDVIRKDDCKLGYIHEVSSQERVGEVFIWDDHPYVLVEYDEEAAVGYFVSTNFIDPTK